MEYTDTSSGLQRLLLECRTAQTSEISGSWYDTAQIIRTCLHHPGTLPQPLVHRSIGVLLDAQHDDGSWGYLRAPAGYRVVPTLAAAAAALAIAGQDTTVGGTTAARARSAAGTALDFLVSEPERCAPETLPDTIAVELIVPAVLEALAQHPSPHTRIGDGIAAALYQQRTNLDSLHRLRRACASGAALPAALHYSLEAIGCPPARYTHDAYLAYDSLACSPAATAAALPWDTRPAPAAVSFLAREGARLGGAWPVVASVPVFETAWTVGAAARLGQTLPADVSAPLASWLASSVRDEGCGAGPALAPDSDDTAGVLFALHALGRPQNPDCLFPYEREDHFVTFPDERTPSTSTNAHVLEVLKAASPENSDADRVLGGIVKAAAYLLDTQCADGYWTDKWHASPYYATACAVLALRDIHRPGMTHSLRRTLRWICENQRMDGSWGCWHGTYEETSYALHILLGINPRWHDKATRSALYQGLRFLNNAVAAGLPEPGWAPLWHAKDLYQPTRVVRAFVLTAMSAAGSRH
ncbi:hypothetical protein [Streptomyces hokutonensis]|uniref:hypothetical protein n=1 Tax=Streptomyces hokutonensis TaxID=1306990 RepID=UPI003812425D